jgi:hypothetical protein
MSGDSSVSITAGSGTPIATYDDTGNVQHQKVVLETQTGSADPVHVNTTNPLPVVVPLLSFDGGGNLLVNLNSGGFGGIQDNFAFVPGSGYGLPIMGERNDTSTVGASEGSAAVVRLTANRAMLAALTASINGGWTPASYFAAASDNLVNVKASAGQIGWAQVVNLAASARYLRLYDKASAPVPGTDTPIYRLAIPANATVPLNFGAAGIAFANGISFDITAGSIADSDTTATAANDVVFNYGWA